VKAVKLDGLDVPEHLNRQEKQWCRCLGRYRCLQRSLASEALAAATNHGVLDNIYRDLYGGLARDTRSCTKETTIKLRTFRTISWNEKMPLNISGALDIKRHLPHTSTGVGAQLMSRRDKATQ
jgi:hypothetical protein